MNRFAFTGCYLPAFEPSNRKCSSNTPKHFRDEPSIELSIRYQSVIERIAKTMRSGCAELFSPFCFSSAPDSDNCDCLEQAYHSLSLHSSITSITCLIQNGSWSLILSGGVKSACSKNWSPERRLTMFQVLPQSFWWQVNWEPSAPFRHNPPHSRVMPSCSSERMQIQLHRFRRTMQELKIKIKQMSFSDWNTSFNVYSNQFTREKCDCFFQVEVLVPLFPMLGNFKSDSKFS